MKVRLLLLALLVSIPAYAGRLEKIETPVSSTFNCIDWHPFENYALVAGEGVYRFLDGGSGYRLDKVPSSPYTVLTALDWRPQGDYALIVSDVGTLYTFDGDDVVALPFNFNTRLTDVAYSPAGDMALITGHQGILLGYMDGAVTEYPFSSKYDFTGAAWHPSGDYALIIGTYDFTYSRVFRWENGGVTLEWSGPSIGFQSIDFHPSGDYATIAETWGNVARYDSLSGHQPLETPFEMEAIGLTSMKWSPNGDVALITGSWNFIPFPPRQDCMEFNGEQFNVLRCDQNLPEPFRDAAWKPDGELAVVVGESGGLMLYDPTSRIIGDLHCNENVYHGGDTLQLFVSLMNPGAPTPVDIYISMDLNGMSYYWPTFGPYPITIPAKLATGFSVKDYLLWQGTVPPVSVAWGLHWYMRIYQAGFTDEDHLLSCSKDLVGFEP